MESKLLQRHLFSLKEQLGFSNEFMVDRVGFLGTLIMLWKIELDVTLKIFSKGHIDVWIENWLPTGASYHTEFYGNWNVSLRKHSWTLMK